MPFSSSHPVPRAKISKKPLFLKLLPTNLSKNYCCYSSRFQYVSFYAAKGILLQRKRPCFAAQNTAFWNVCCNVLVASVLCLVFPRVLIVLAFAACG